MVYLPHIRPNYTLALCTSAQFSNLNLYALSSTCDTPHASRSYLFRKSVSQFHYLSFGCMYLYFDCHESRLFLDSLDSSILFMCPLNVLSVFQFRLSLPALCVLDLCSSKNIVFPSFEFVQCPCNSFFLKFKFYPYKGVLVCWPC